MNILIYLTTTTMTVKGSKKKEKFCQMMDGNYIIERKGVKYEN